MHGRVVVDNKNEFQRKRNKKEKGPQRGTSETAPQIEFLKQHVVRTRKELEAKKIRF